MRWTFLDYCLLTCAILSGLLIQQHAFAQCQYNICAPVKIHGIIFSSTEVAYYEWEDLDCRICKQAHGYCTWGPWGADCVDNPSKDQQIRALGGGQLKCNSGIVGNNCEAWSDSGILPRGWVASGKQKWCQGPPQQEE